MRSLATALLLALVAVAPAQTPSVPNLQPVFSFEVEHTGSIPRGWGGGPAGTIFVDRDVVHAGRAAVRLERTAESPNQFTTLTLGLPLDVAGERIEWRGFLKTEGVSNYTGLWMREDGDTPSLAFDNMERRQIKGTNDWTAYSITLPVHPRVALAPNVGNPIFQNEPGYPALRFPDAGYQLLGLFRYWNIIQYWYPNRDLIDENWDDVLKEFIPRVARAQNRDAYQLEMLALIARITDTHANLNVQAAVRPPAGTCQLPLVLRFLESRAVVAGFSSPAGAPASAFRIGDVIESLDGETVAELVDRVSPHYPASNEATRLRDIARVLTRGACAPVNVAVSRAEDTVRITAERVPLASINASAGITHDLPGETFQILPENVAYLKLSQVRAADLPGQIRRAATTRGLIIDIRNYPSEFVVFALGSLLMEQPTAFARFTTGVLENPGAFRWTAPVTIQPQEPHFGGPVVILVDETSVSQAEYTAMAFRASPRAIVVGSTTAGADGNVSQIPLPGGLMTAISGIGVFYPDKQPTQRVGILSDVDIRPTIAGIQAGKDEVLEEAIRQILDPQLR